jgi:hypothetical protein
MATSKPQIIFVDPAEDVSEVVRKISSAKGHDITLSIPHRALILQNPINLAIIKHSADKLGRNLIIATLDPVGQKFAQEADMSVGGQISELPSEREVSNQADLIVEDLPEADNPEDFVEESEIDARFLPAGKTINPLSGFRLKSLNRVEPDEPTEPSSPVSRRFAWQLPKINLPKIKLSKPSLAPHQKISIAIAGVGLILLAVVGFFVLPKAYVALEVQSEPYKKQFTLTLADEQDLQAAGPNILPGRFVQVTRENVASFTASGEQNKGAVAYGQINAVNFTNGIQGILANTRFVSSTGLGFTIKNDVLVPPARGNTPGRAVVEATADSGGTKYNVSSPLKLDIPNLSAGLKPLLYGEIVGTFTGGTDNIVKVVSQEDIDRGKEEASKNVFSSAESELGKQVKRGEDFNPAFIQNDVIDAVPSVTPGAEQTNFEIRVQSRSWTILIPKNKFPEALTNAATFEVDADKQVTDQTLKSAKIEPVESSFITHRVNLLISLDGHIGPRINVEEIVKNLVNKPRADAEHYLTGLTNLSSSSIDVWPTFLRRMPLLTNNVRVQIIYLGE